MTIEIARVQKKTKPWGKTDARPWLYDSAAGPIGELVYERPGKGNLPPKLLLKILLTSQALSVQVHPDDAMALSMGMANGKTEAWYVLHAEPGARVALGLIQSMTQEELRASMYDGSIADLVAWQQVAVGDVISVPAGTIHAIGAGLVIAEIQQRSDTTFRLFDYGRNRELHVESALRAAIAQPTAPHNHPQLLSEQRLLLVQNSYFLFERVELSPGSVWMLNAKLETWILNTAGKSFIGDFEISIGEALFLEQERVEIRAGDLGITMLVAYLSDGRPMRELLTQVATGHPHIEKNVAEQSRFPAGTISVNHS
jgi:mannose-6-phosphate isomerase